jgi:hypothetical protein
MKLTSISSFLGAAVSLASMAAHVGPVPNGLHPSADQIAVYRSFLASYATGAAGPVNLGNRTIPLELPDSDIRDGCLKGIVLLELASLRSGSQPLTPEVVDETNVRLVDPEHQASAVKTSDPSLAIHNGAPVEDAVRAASASGLLQVSGIAFDRKRRYGVMAFGFSCGELCGHGGTLVFEKAHGQWRRVKRGCRVWVS